MSHRGRNGGAARRQAHASAFAALGDETRLALVAKLSDGRRYSISQLSDAQPFGGSNNGGSKLTRQAITKHLRVLERVGMVRCQREGRESRFAFDPRPVMEMREYLEKVSAEWDAALGRLKAFVED